MTKSVLSIGSNLGDRLANLQSAVTGLINHPEISLVKVSSVFETKPFGGPEQDDFLNAVIEIETELSPKSLLEFAQKLENESGRVREVRWGPRTLDVDILVYGEQVSLDENLILPHPRISERAFVLVPWFELDPNATIPNLGNLAELHKTIDKADVQLKSEMKLKGSK